MICSFSIIGGVLCTDARVCRHLERPEEPSPQLPRFIFRFRNLWHDPELHNKLHFYSWILTFAIHILLSTVLEKKWIGSKTLKFFFNWKCLLCFSLLPLGGQFFVLDLLECELQARKMFLGFIKRYIWRAKVTKIWRNDPFAHSTPYTTSGLSGCLLTNEITLFLSPQGHPVGRAAAASTQLAN